MNISQTGLDLIKDFESYLRPLKDGSCMAYRCPAGVWTLGWGCTKGIKAGMTWTRAQAEAELRKELAECESAVTRLVTVPITQPQFDALVSFAYNCGTGALQRSTILRKLNRGDHEGAAAAFMAWDKATVNGKRVALRGLTRRRAAERAMFLATPEDAEPEPMPQKVESPPSVPAVPATLTGGGILAGGAIMADPVGTTSMLVAVKGNATQLMPTGLSLGAWLIPLVLGGALIAWLLWKEKQA